MKQVLIISILLLCHSLRAQQPLISQVYEDYDGNSSVTVIAEDDGYLMVGVGYVLETGGKAAIKMLRTDLQGVLVWKSIYGDSIFGYSMGEVASTVKSINNNSYITFGNRCTPSLVCKGLIVKHNLAGDTLWSQVYGGNGRNLFNSGLEMDNGDLVAAGRSSVGSAPEQVWLVRTDSLGNLKWQQHYGGNEFEECRKILLTSDGGFILAGATDSYGAGLRDGYLIKTDSMGNLLWQKTYGTNWKEYSLSITHSRNGGYYIWGLSQDEDMTGFPTYEKKTYIKKIDANGDEVWTKTLHQDFFRWVSIDQVRETNQGRELIVVGEKDNPIDSLNSGWVAKLDSSGNLLWERFYVNHDNNNLGAWLYDFQLLDDGGIACTGSGNVPGTVWANRTDFWLLILDSMGCLQPGCDTITGMGDVKQDISILVSVYPNPTRNNITVSIPIKSGFQEYYFTLTNLLGQQVFKNQISNAQTTFDLDLPSGIYLYQVTHNGQVVTGKLLLE